MSRYSNRKYSFDVSKYKNKVPERQNRKNMIEKELPYPPTINNYYVRSKYGAIFINQKGRSYRAAVQYNMRHEKPIEGKIKLHIDVFPPDKKKRDMDNLNKCLLDSLQNTGVIKDDYDIDQLSMTRRDVIQGGKSQALSTIVPSNSYGLSEELEVREEY